MSRKPLERVLVIIPTYNEAQNIESIITRLRTCEPQVHVLIADDNSPDGTGQIADRLAADDDHVHVLHRAGKEGLGAAYLAGFTWGLERGYDALVEMDADGSHSPEQLHRLLDALADADMVKGSRYVKGGKVVNWPKSRLLLSRGGSVYIRAMLGMPYKDVTGGFNAFRADALVDIIQQPIDRHGYGIQRDLTWHAHQRGYRIVEVPITFVEREFGDSKMSRNVVVEAMVRTTALGAKHRGNQVANAVRRVLGKTARH